MFNFKYKLSWLHRSLRADTSKRNSTNTWGRSVHRPLNHFTLYNWELNKLRASAHENPFNLVENSRRAANRISEVNCIKCVARYEIFYESVCCCCRISTRPIILFASLDYAAISLHCRLSFQFDALSCVEYSQYSATLAVNAMETATRMALAMSSLMTSRHR